MVEIVQNPNQALRSPAQDVPPSMIGSSVLKHVITSMKQALHHEPDGVAIAAPQIAEPWRIFVVAGSVFDIKKKNKGGTPTADRVFINPKLIKSSRETAWISGEGCLSVRWVYGTTKRHKKVTVCAMDEQGKTFTLQASGLLSQIFQHEIDHLEGILFIDHAKDVASLSDQERKDYERKIEHLRTHHHE